MTSPWLERAQQSQQLKRVLDDFLAGHSTREDVEQSAQAIAHVAQRRLGFLAPMISSLINATEVQHGEFVVRRVDFESYARELSEGYDRFESTPLMTIAQSAVLAASERHASPWSRSWVDGLGWFGFAMIGSPATGRRLRATWMDLDLAPGSMSGGQRVAGVVVPRGGNVDEAARDAIETFELSDEQILELHPDVRASTWPRFVVVRQDDHGNRYDVGESRSEAFALARLAHFESLGHKQTYSVETRESMPFERPTAARFL
jgi:hypothetical protein